MFIFRGILKTLPVEPISQSSLENRIAAKLTSVDATLPVGPLELQIAYKHYLYTPKDFEDAVHFYSLFEETLRIPQLEQWATKLGVEDEYDRIKQA